MNRKGSITVISGPMFGGKTTRLLAEALKAKTNNQDVLVIKPAIDNRYSTDKVVSHDGLSFPALSAREWPKEANKADCILIDEVQFMENDNWAGSVVEDIRKAATRGADIYASALDMDWQGKPFFVTGQLMAMADSLEKVKSVCAVCGEPAAFTFKQKADDSVIQVGGAELYEPRCRVHWHDHEDSV